MTAMVTVLYEFRGKVEIERVRWFDTTSRSTTLNNLTRATIYTMVDGDNELRTYNGVNWYVAKNVPNEIKLAAMLLD